MILFGEYLPDLPPLENPGLILAQNVLPGNTSYLPVPAATDYSDDTLDGRPQGAFSARDNTNNNIPYTFVGTADKLYQFTSTTFTDVTRLSGPYNTDADDIWDFTQWGNDIIATNFTDNIQTLTLGGLNFADLGGSPPKARYVATVGNFLVVGNTWDASDGYQPQRVRWAGIGTTTSWTVSATTQADFQDLRNNGGYIQRIVGGEYAIIFQESAITRMSYVGAPLIFQMDLIESNRGTIAPASVIKIGNNIAFLDDDGFYVFDGNQSIPISDGKIVDTFFADLDITYVTNISVALYPSLNVIVWSYPSINATPAGINDKVLFYNYSPRSKTRWAFANVNNYLVLNPVSKAYTLDGLDAVSTNLDTLPFSLDSRVWMGNLNLMGSIGSDFKLQLWNGAPLDAALATGEGWLKEPRRTMVTLIRPHIDLNNTGTVMVQVGSRDLESATISYNTTASLNIYGFAPVRVNARFLSAKFLLTGDFAGAQGFDVITSTPVGLL